MFAMVSSVDSAWVDAIEPSAVSIIESTVCWMYFFSSFKSRFVASFVSGNSMLVRLMLKLVGHRVSEAGGMERWTSRFL